jgi:hypothetical protein
VPWTQTLTSSLRPPHVDAIKYWLSLVIKGSETLEWSILLITNLWNKMTNTLIFNILYTKFGGRSQWTRGLRRGSVAERLLGSWVRIPPGAWMFLSCECCVLSGRGLCDGPIPRPEESYRVWCVFECDQVKNKNPLHLLQTSRYKMEGLRNENSGCAVNISTLDVLISITYTWQ